MRGDDAHAEPVRRVGPGPRVDDVEHVGRSEPRRDLLPQPVVVVFGQLLVDVAPPDAVGGERLVDEELVLGRAAREGTGVDDEWAAFRELAVAAPQGVRVEQRGGRVSIDGAGRVDPLLGEIHAAGELSRCHPERLLQTVGQVGHGAVGAARWGRRTAAWYGLPQPGRPGRRRPSRVESVRGPAALARLRNPWSDHKTGLDQPRPVSGSSLQTTPWGTFVTLP